MAFTPLSTDYKDEILSEVNTQRKYKQTVNEDGTISLQDMTAYEQEGSTYSAKDINEERKAINDIYANKVVSLEEASLVTEPGFFCDALVVNELNKNIPRFYSKEATLAYSNSKCMKGKTYVGEQFSGCIPQLTLLAKTQQPYTQTNAVISDRVDSEGNVNILAYGSGYVNGHVLTVTVFVCK